MTLLCVPAGCACRTPGSSHQTDGDHPLLCRFLLLLFTTLFRNACVSSIGTDTNNDPGLVEPIVLP